MKSTSSHRTALLLFGLCLCVYWAALQGHLNSPDELQAVLQAESLIERGELSVAYREDLSAFMTEGAEGRYYVTAPVGHSVILLPWVALGNFLGGGREGIRDLVVSSFNSFVAALIVAFFFLCALDLGFSKGAVLASSAILAFTTPLWPYARFTFAEPAGGLFLLLGFWAHIRGCPLGAALALGAAFLVKYELLPLAAVFGLAYLLEKRWKDLLLYALGYIPFLLFFILLNWIRMGSFSSPGYPASYWSLANLGEGMAGILVSPGVGISWYAPPLLLALWAWNDLRARSKESAWLILGLFLAHLLFNSAYRYWTGGWAWGGKRMVPLLPILFLGLPPLLEGARTLWRRAVIALLAVLGLFVQLLSMVVPFTLHLMWASDDPFYAGWIHPLIVKRPWEATLWNPAQSPLWDRALLLFRSSEPLDLLVLHPACPWGGLFFGLTAILAGIFTLGLLREAKKSEKELTGGPQ